METKREIGSAIKKRMGDLNSSPLPEVWHTLKENLELKKRRRVFSFWFYLIGIALLTMFATFIIGTSGYFRPYKSQEQIGFKIDSKTLVIDNSVTNCDSIKLVKQSKAISSVPNDNISKSLAQNNHLKKGTRDLYDTDKNNSRDKNRSTNKTLYKNSINIKNILKTPVLVAIDKEKAPTLSAQGIVRSKKKSVLADFPAGFESHQKMHDTAAFKKGAAQELRELDSLKKINKKAKHQLLKKKLDSLEEIQRYRSLTLYSGLSSGDLFWKNSRLDSRLSQNDKDPTIKLNYGVLLSFHNASRFSIRIGVLYKQYQNNIEDSVYFTSFTYVTITASDDAINSFASSGLKHSVNQEYSYLMIPFEMRYDLLKSASLVGLIGGINYSMLLKNKVTIKNEDNNTLEIGRSSSLARNDFSLNTGISVRPILSDRLFLNMEALFYFQPFRYNENSLRSGMDLQFKVGLEYKL